jgi:hypothetical protein
VAGALPAMRIGLRRGAITMSVSWPGQAQDQRMKPAKKSANSS